MTQKTKTKKETGPADRLALAVAIIVGGVPALYLALCAVGGFFWAVARSAAFMWGAGPRDYEAAAMAALVWCAVAITFAIWIVSPWRKGR